MLLGPEFHHRLGQPNAQRAQAVHPRMAGGAQRDERGGSGISRFAVVDMEPASALPCPAAAALPPVAVEDLLPVAGKVRARVRPRPVTDPAQAGNGRGSPPAGAKQGDLGGARQRMGRPGARENSRNGRNASKFSYEEKAAICS